jgi:hypothetical protein
VASAYFAVDGSGKYRVDIEIRTGGGGMQHMNILYDTGNDITILKTSTGQKLGLGNEQGEPFNVGGINGPGKEFMRITNLIRIQGLNPIWVPMGIAMDERSLYEDLMGRAGILDTGIYEIRQDERGIMFIEKQPAVAMLANAGGGRLPSRFRNALYGHRGLY